jgi:hypothetical protein
MASHTGTSDKDYNLVSVLYHTLSGADSCTTYIKDADHANDKELSDFFSESLTTYRTLADKAKKLAAARLARTG